MSDSEGKTNKNRYSYTFGLGNFKAFEKIQNIEIAPITLIYGQNSGGKSTLLQSILSFAQSSSSLVEGEFKFCGDKIDAGTFDTIINNKLRSKNNHIVIESSNKYSSRSPYNRNIVIDTFNVINEAKIRYYITSSNKDSQVNVEKVEIIFDDFL